MSHEMDVRLLEKLRDQPYWGGLVERAEKVAATVVVSQKPYRKLTRDHPLWHDVVGTFVIAANNIAPEKIPKEEDAAWAYRFTVGRNAVFEFLGKEQERQVREVSFSSDTAQAYFAGYSRDGDDGPINPEDAIADEYVDPADRLERKLMLKVVRDAIAGLPENEKQAIQKHGGIGEIPELDGYEPRDPNKDGSGGARGMRDAEIGPAIGTSARHVGNLLRKARSTIRKALNKNGYLLSHVREVFPGLCIEETNHEADDD